MPAAQPGRLREAGVGMRRFLGFVGAIALLTTTAVTPATAAGRPSSYRDVTITQFSPTRVAQGSKSRSGGLALSDPDLLARRDSKVIPIMVKMDVDPVASYTGGVDNLVATSPAKTGKTLSDNGSAVVRYTSYLQTRAFGIRRGVQRAVPAARLGHNFLQAYGGFSAMIPANKAKDLLQVPGVAAVQYDALNQPLANSSPIYVGATSVWPSLGGESKAGKGLRLGVLDTGIWPEHPMLDDPGIPFPGGGPYACDFGDLGDHFDASFSCNDKLIGAYAFLETNLLVGGPDVGEYCTSADNSDPASDDCSARDADGHGTHTATTSAGSPVDHSVLYGVDRGHISGIAPGASVIAYRVCDADGCYSSDSVAAVEQAISDGIDVINYSIGGGVHPYTDSVELAFLDAYAAGILVNASAGNAGPDAATAEHGGAWVNTVGASTLDRSFATTLHLTASGGAHLNIVGASITEGISSPTAVVLGSDTVSGELCDFEAGSGDYTGKVVVCKRGENARIEKGYNVGAGDAAGMILYNTIETDVETDNHFLPAIHLNDPTESIVAFVSSHSGVKATWTTGAATSSTGDIMASFSSRGPLGDWIKPDVTAPGVQILAANSPHHLFDPADGLGPDGESYQAIAGTSMSSPHAAGVALLIKAKHPSWTPGQIKSAMMTSSLQDVLKEDGSTPADPFDRGAGSIRANRAINPTVTFDVLAWQFYAAASDEFARLDLNIASVNAPNMPGVMTTTRTIKNVTGVTQTLDFTTTAPRHSSIVVTPSKLTLAPGKSGTFEITINGKKLADGQYFGQITIDPETSGFNNAVVPVAFDKHPGDVTFENSCGTSASSFVGDQVTIAKGSNAQCAVTVTNYANTDAHVNVRVQGPRGDRLRIRKWSDGRKLRNGFVWNGVLDPAAAPEILGLFSPGYGYLSLPGLGLTPEDPFTDETIADYVGVPPFVYGGEVYDELAIDSNGYVVVGGGAIEDNECCFPAMPDPTRPNNVLAPFWTDLNPEDGGDIYFGEVDFGFGYTYLVIEWNQVPVFGSCDTTCKPRTFQLWMGEVTVGEDISFEYCVNPNSDPLSDANPFGCDDTTSESVGPGAAYIDSTAGGGLIVGAENRDGSSAATIGPLDTEPLNDGYVVYAGSPLAGGSKTITYKAKGRRKGWYIINSSMTSDVTQGADKERVSVHVVSPH